MAAFLAVVDQGGVSPAARHLDVPKSTVSRRLTRLEDQLGVTLIYRSTRQLTLTEVGRDLVGRARRLLEEADALVASTSGVRAEPQGVLRASAPTDLSAQVELWGSFAEVHPRVELRLEFTNRYVDVVGEGFDVAFRGGPGKDPDLMARRVGTYCLHAVATPDWVKKHGRLHDFRELWHHDCVLLKGLVPRDDLVPPNPIEPFRHTVVNDLRVVRDGVLRGLGIGILPQDLVAEDLAEGRLEPVLDAYDPLEVPLYAVYPDRRYLPAAVVALIGHLQSHLRR